MIILNVTYKCKPGKRNAFFEAVKNEGIDSASRAEEGNIKYSYYLSLENDDELFLLEKWKDSEAISEHGEKAHFKRLGDLKAEYVLETIIDKFQVIE